MTVQSLFAEAGINLTIPAGVLALSPIVAMLALVTVYIRKNGVPSLPHIVAGVLVFFGSSVMIMCGCAFGLKLFQPDDNIMMSIDNSYMGVGSAIGFVLVLVGVVIHVSNNQK